MVKHILLFLVLACTSLQTFAQNPPLSAFVDRTDVSINDVLTLTIRIDAALGNSRPTLTDLNREFEQVGGLSTRSTYTNTNGTIQSWTEYSITLRPLTTGVLTIPAFRVNGESSKPITINVGDATQTTSTGGTEEIYIESTVSKNTVYVQEQLLYIIKIYYAIGFDQGAQLSSPTVDDAVVQQLGSDDNYQEVVNGIGYNVTERRFVIFPQSSGELTIPSVYFIASVGRRGGINRFFNNRTAVREINLMTEPHAITVLARPTTFTGTTWLPAAALSLEESWSGSLDNVSVGTALTRNIVLTSNGLSSSLLPGIEYADQTGLKFYPDQPVREDVVDKNGVVGKRSEGTAIVASMPGVFELPEVRMQWWNTVSNTLETAVLPARVLTVVAAGADAEQTTNNNPNFVDIAGGQNNVDGALVPASQDSGTNLLWISTTIFFAAAWLCSTLLWLRSRGQVVQTNPASGADPQPLLMTKLRKQTDLNTLPDPATSLRSLKTACDNQRLPDIRRALIQWAQGSFQTPDILTLDTLARHCKDEHLTSMLSTLDKALYSNAEGNPFNSTELYFLVSQLHQKGLKLPQADKKYALPPLYKH